MLDATVQQEFEQALSATAYTAAWRYCCRLCPVREDAEDLLQDSLARACQAFSQLREPDRFKGWLLMIVRSSHLMRLRSQRCRPQLIPDYPEITVSAATDPFVADVFAGMNSLKAMERELLTLFYLDGLSITEVAQVTGVNARAIRQRMLRARRSLRQRVLASIGEGSKHNLISPYTDGGEQ